VKDLRHGARRIGLAVLRLDADVAVADRDVHEGDRPTGGRALAHPRPRVVDRHARRIAAHEHREAATVGAGGTDREPCRVSRARRVVLAAGETQAAATVAG
jgi:hypothetical protein